ncbi:hypothetical protein [uncultured Bradyrhizobium sp.]|jgi:hypothetical protein|uniref:hypothetical protein n=1 Tax=uncultured Bradyrhizobium sp. TaxID=199684 RepID=UPI0026241DB6|nr:hypothetical protein [uncultured Bradyrhizobium sp.]
MRVFERLRERIRVPSGYDDLEVERRDRYSFKGNLPEPSAGTRADQSTPSAAFLLDLRLVAQIQPKQIEGEVDRSICGRAGTRATMNREPTGDQVKALLESANRATQAIGGRVGRAKS